MGSCASNRGVANPARPSHWHRISFYQHLFDSSSRPLRLCGESAPLRDLLHELRALFIMVLTLTHSNLENDMSRKKIKSGLRRQRLVKFNLAREVHYIQRRPKSAQKRNPFVLPNAYDDLFIGYQRSWKGHRVTQRKNAGSIDRRIHSPPFWAS
jgi:hypothetical protein